MMLTKDYEFSISTELSRRTGTDILTEVLATIGQYKIADLEVVLQFSSNDSEPRGARMLWRDGAICNKESFEANL